MTATASPELDGAAQPLDNASCQRTLMGTDDPQEALARGQELAALLQPVFEERELVVTFTDKRGRESRHPRVEAWQMLAALVGVSAHCAWTREVFSSDGQLIGWSARCEATSHDGRLVGAGEMMCLRLESKWRTADAFAMRSMAQTRATSKSLKCCLGWVMPLMGLSSTPAEEMGVEEVSGDAAVIMPVHLSREEAKELSERAKNAGVSETAYREQLLALGVSKLADMTPAAVAQVEAWLAQQTPVPLAA